MASFIVTIIVILLIVVPLFLVLNTVSREIHFLYLVYKEKVSTGEIFIGRCTESESIECKITNYFKVLFSDPKTKYYLDSAINEVKEFFVEHISSFLFSIPLIFLNFFIIIFTTFFFFKDGGILVKKIEDLLPLKKVHKEHVFAKFNDVTYAVVYGSIIVAIIQGSLGGIGFFAVGIPGALIWAVIMMFFALVPYVGSTIIWLPAALILMFNGYIESNTFMMVKGILLIFYGTFVVGLVDNFLKPKIIGDRARVHPVLVLLGVLGGLKFFGFIGIILGPVLLALLVTFIKIYEEEKYF